MPVYVLTGGWTASAAEEFVSHVARLHFATLIGETTAGAANRNDEYPMPGGYVLSVSVGYPELPGGGNWEGKGVAPDIAVPDRARAGSRAAGGGARRLRKRPEGPERTQLEWAAALLWCACRSDRAPARAGPPMPAALACGPSAVENGMLTWQRDGGPKSVLVPLGGDLFAMESDPRSHMRFTGEGAVTGVTIERADGTSSPNPRG
jgi:hypothetical protein